jgi:tetratricopeptide (TPR) repeat protein
MHSTISDALDQGIASLRAQQTGEAIRSFTTILQAHPEHPEANFCMGKASLSLGKGEEALPYFKRALESKPSEGKYWLSYIDILLMLGRLDSAQKVVDLAVSAGAEGPIFRSITDKLDELKAVSTSDVSPQEPSKPLFQSVEVLYQAKCYTEALFRTQALLKHFPNSVNLLLLEAACRFECSAFEDAADSYSKAILIYPEFADAHNNLGVVFKAMYRLDEAAAEFLLAINLNPALSEAYYNLAQVRRIENNMEAAAEYFSKAVESTTKYTEAYYQLGATHEAMGRRDDAEKCYLQAVESDPHYTAPFYSLARLTRLSQDDATVVLMQKLLGSTDTSESQKIPLYFALGEVHEKLGLLEESFEYYAHGNAIAKSSSGYNIQSDVDSFYKLKNNCNGLIANAVDPSLTTRSINPIFILGMPRSGTSLVEQIIASHSKVDGAGELDYISFYGAKITENDGKKDIEALKEFRGRYLEKLKRHSHNGTYVTDKMPHNFKHIGLILSAIPEATVIHVVRNPAAVCWSNFKTLFGGSSFGYSNDLDDLVNYFKLYEGLMNFWDSKFPGRIYKLDYEALTIDQKVQTQKLLEFIGLDIEDACYFPEKNLRSVKTASGLQVRQSVYKNSSDAWRKFAPFLGGAFDELEPV